MKFFAHIAGFFRAIAEWNSGSDKWAMADEELRKRNAEDLGRAINKKW